MLCCAGLTQAGLLLSVLSVGLSVLLDLLSVRSLVEQRHLLVPVVELVQVERVRRVGRCS